MFREVLLCLKTRQLMILSVTKDYVRSKFATWEITAYRSKVHGRLKRRCSRQKSKVLTLNPKDKYLPEYKLKM